LIDHHMFDALKRILLSSTFPYVHSSIPYFNPYLMYSQQSAKKSPLLWCIWPSVCNFFHTHQLRIAKQVFVEFNLKN
jgi:hypothetical protein